MERGSICRVGTSILDSKEEFMTSFKFKIGVGLLWIVVAAVVHAMTDASWELCWVIAAAFSYIWILQYKIDSITSAFGIADAELVRVSALANDLESNVAELRQRLESVTSQVNLD
jgi:hypothetical protein